MFHELINTVYSNASVRLLSHVSGNTSNNVINRKRDIYIVHALITSEKTER